MRIELKPDVLDLRPRSRSRPSNGFWVGFVFATLLTVAPLIQGESPFFVLFLFSPWAYVVCCSLGVGLGWVGAHMVKLVK